MRLRVLEQTDASPLDQQQALDPRVLNLNSEADQLCGTLASMRRVFDILKKELS
jgi:hypothetical protein